MTQAVFRGKVAIITGGSAGIGLEVARQLAGQGALLVLAARDPSLLESAAAECRKLGARAIGVPTDVADKSHCRLLIDAAITEFGRIDMLVNNAGISMHARFDELTDIDVAERIITINYLGSVWCTYYALPHLKSARGRIVAVSSLAAKNGVPTRTLYSASKHAMAGFFDSLRIELRDHNVSVTVVYPGFVATDKWHRAVASDGGTLGTRPVRKTVMSAEDCARKIIEAAGLRRREVVMSLVARVGMFMKLILPHAADTVAQWKVTHGR